jgi:hypothetical protein
MGGLLGAPKAPAARGMSALGQKQTLPHICVMSALPPKADIDWHHSNVCFVPIADIRKLVPGTDWT